MELEITRILFTVMEEASFHPAMETSFDPPRILLIRGTPIEKSVLTVCYEEGEVLLEDLAGYRGRLYQRFETTMPSRKVIAVFPIGSPTCFDDLINRVKKLWHDEIPFDLLGRDHE